jgi:hypothetical protein
MAEPIRSASRFASRFASCLAVIGVALVTIAVRQPADRPPTGSPVASTVASERGPAVAFGPVMVSAPVAHPARTHRPHHSATRPVVRRPVTLPAAHGAAVVQSHGVAHTEHRGSTAAKPVVHHPARRPRAHVAGPTHWAALNAAIARIPSYHPGSARWVVSSKFDFWGTADWYADVLYVAPSVPSDRLYDVAVHEWSHELSVLDYAGDVNAAVSAMRRHFGGAGLMGAEYAADCMSKLQGAVWTHYTQCSNSHWRAMARRLLAGKRL